MERDPKSYSVRAVERAVRILSTFDNEHMEQGVAEIAQTTGLHKATAHRITMTLTNSGFLERAADGDKFRLGLPVVYGLYASFVPVITWPASRGSPPCVSAVTTTGGT